MIYTLLITFVVIIISGCVLNWYFPALRNYSAGFLIGTSISAIILLHYAWYSGFIEERGVTVSRMLYHYNFKREDDKKVILQMTENDVINFFKNGSNFIQDRMYEQLVRYGDDAVSVADVIDDGKAFSLIATAFRDRKGYLDWLNWGDPFQIIYMINPCIIEFSDIPKESENLIKAKQPKGVNDVILVSFSTTVLSDFKKGRFKIRDMPFHPIYGYQAIAVKKIIELYTPKSKCFKSI